MEWLGLEPGAAGWQAQTKPWSYGGHPIYSSSELSTKKVLFKITTYYWLHQLYLRCRYSNMPRQYYFNFKNASLKQNCRMNSHVCTKTKCFKVVHITAYLLSGCFLMLMSLPFDQQPEASILLGRQASKYTFLLRKRQLLYALTASQSGSNFIRVKGDKVSLRCPINFFGIKKLKIKIGSHPVSACACLSVP